MVKSLGYFSISIPLLTLLLLIHNRTHSQQMYNQSSEFINGNSNWVWGMGAGLNFNTNPPTVFSAPLYVQSFLECFSATPAWAKGRRGSSSVSSRTTGALLFYTNGKGVIDANHQLMPNGDSLKGNILSVVYQGSCIVPFPNDTNKYYVFSHGGYGGLCCASTCLEIGSYGPGPTYFDATFYNDSVENPAMGLYYSVVDMTLNGGLGDVVPTQKNIQLSSKSAWHTGMIAIPGDNCNIWLLVHPGITQGEFWAYNIHENGVDPNPVVSPGIKNSWLGMLKVAPDRRTIAIANRPFHNKLVNGNELLNAEKKSLYLFRFDPATGSVSDKINLSPNGISNRFPQTEDAEFSPNGKKLYANASMTYSLNGQAPYNLEYDSLFQFDISNYDSVAIMNSKVCIKGTHAAKNNNYPIASFMRLYKEKIFVHNHNFRNGVGFQPMDLHDTALGIINSPDALGTACDYQPLSLSLYHPGYSSYYYTRPYLALPNQVVYPLLGTVYRKHLDTLCVDKNGHISTLLLQADQSSVNGYLWNDGSVDSFKEVIHPGIYILSWQKDFCTAVIDTFIVLGSDEVFTLGDDTAICNNDRRITLSLPSWAVDPTWQDGSKSRNYQVKQSGKYWVTINQNGCFYSDTISVGEINIQQDLGEDIILCKGEPVHLVLKANVPAGGLAVWNTGYNGVSLLVKDTGTYWVNVSHPDCPPSADTITISNALCDCYLFTPNAFTPNGDGINDIFLPSIELGCPIKNYNLNIYNRFGERVFNSAKPGIGWDGTYKNQPVDAGTYFFEVSFYGGLYNKEFYRKGDVAVIR